MGETIDSHHLIASDRVEGTAVYDRAGEKLGTIVNFMVDKESGRAEFAVMKFGGLLGIGSDQYPIPWAMLTYDRNQGGYVVDLDKARLENAPHYAENEPLYDRDYNDMVDAYYEKQTGPFI